MPDIVNVSGNIYAIAYTRSSIGYIKTVQIDGTTGAITNTGFAAVQFENNSCAAPKIIHAGSGTVYTVAYYRTSNQRGYLRSMFIAANGQVTAGPAAVRFDASAGLAPDIVFVAGNIYGVAYNDSSNRGYLRTMNINPTTGAVTAGPAAVRFDGATGSGLDPDIIHLVSGNYYAVAYRDQNNLGYLKTMSIDPGTGVVTAGPAAVRYDATSNSALEPEVISTSGNVYAVAYRNATNNSGYLKTMTINPATGTVTDTGFGAVQFDTSAGYTPSFTPVAGSVYAIAYRGVSSHGVVKTFEILTGGQITPAAIDSLEFDTSAGYEPWLINVGSSMYAVAYRGTADYGYVATIGIAQTAGSGTSVFSVESSAGGNTILSSVQINGMTTKITSWVKQ
jgi:hypothetical protein